MTVLFLLVNTYWPKQVTQPCPDLRGREREPCHNRRSGKVAFQRDVHMVKGGIIVVIFGKKIKRKSTMGAGENSNSSRGIELKPKQEFDLTNKHTWYSTLHETD